MIRPENRLLDSPLRHGGHVEFIRLWASASRRIHAYITTMVFNVADAEDLLQEVGVTAWQKFEEYEPDRDFVAWTCGIARNKVLLFNRLARHRLVQSSELLERVEQEVRNDSRMLERQHEVLRECLSKLSDRDRKLLQIRYSDGITLKSVASETGQSLQALYKSLQRIHIRLLECVTRRLALREER